MSVRVPAREAAPGWYRSKLGQRLRIVKPSQVSARWHAQGGRDGIPYRAYACDVRYGHDFYGWLPPDYEIMPTGAPRSFAARARRAARVLAEWRAKQADGLAAAQLDLLKNRKTPLTTVAQQR